jgi:hypothetical protein
MKSRHPRLSLQGFPPDPAWVADLREFSTVPEEGEMDAAEWAAHCRRRAEILRRWPDRFRALGLDPEAEAAEMDKSASKMARLAVEYDTALEGFLQQTADVADAEYSLFKEADALVKKLDENDPSDPGVRQLKEALDEARKNFPKE